MCNTFKISLRRGSVTAVAYLEGRKSQQGQVLPSETRKWHVNHQDKRNVNTENLYKEIIVVINEIKSESLRGPEQSIQLQVIDQEKKWVSLSALGI